MVDDGAVLGEAGGVAGHLHGAAVALLVCVFFGFSSFLSSFGSFDLFLAFFAGFGWVLPIRALPGRVRMP